MRRMSLRLPPDLDAQLTREAAVSKQPKATICRTAILEYLATPLRERQKTRKVPIPNPRQA
jgi:predicted transcriptional regulator